MSNRSISLFKSERSIRLPDKPIKISVSACRNQVFLFLHFDKLKSLFPACIFVVCDINHPGLPGVIVHKLDAYATG